MRIKTTELQKALDFLRKNGDTQSIDIEVDNNLKSRVILKADALGDPIEIVIFDAELNVFPKITRTERL